MKWMNEYRCHCIINIIFIIALSYFFTVVWMGILNVCVIMFILGINHIFVYWISCIYIDYISCVFGGKKRRA